MNGARQRSLIFPREHGAWGILLVPLATGAAVGLIAGGQARPLAPLVVAAVALFWLRTPVESWLGNTPVRARTGAEIRLVRNVIIGLSAVSIAALAATFWGGRNLSLLWLGGAAASAFVAQAAARQVFRNGRTAGQAIGAAGLTSVAPAAYYVGTGNLDGIAWSLWAANFLFAANQIHFVHLRIAAARLLKPGEKVSRGRWFLIGQVSLIGLLIVVCLFRLPGYFFAAAFPPVLFRGFAWFAAKPAPLRIHALGVSELLHACVFGALLVLAFRLGVGGG
ncbi:MAG TPA: YwiC-like family protein [Bryobacteraceae bacterium]|nr:YwiC-like family protein [Bryobacteraceae bacterium]